MILVASITTMVQVPWSWNSCLYHGSRITMVPGKLWYSLPCTGTIVLMVSAVLVGVRRPWHWYPGTSSTMVTVPWSPYCYQYQGTTDVMSTMVLVHSKEYHGLPGTSFRIGRTTTAMLQIRRLRLRPSLHITNRHVDRQLLSGQSRRLRHCTYVRR